MCSLLLKGEKAQTSQTDVLPFYPIQTPPPHCHPIRKSTQSTLNPKNKNTRTSTQRPTPHPSTDPRNNLSNTMADPTFLILTPRLRITHLLPTSTSHCEFLVRLWNTPEFLASIDGKPTKITSAEAAKTLIGGRFADEYVRNGYGTFLVELGGSASTPATSASEGSEATPATTTTTTTPIGTVSLTKGDSPTSFKIPDLGFAIVSERLRQGYATEAARGVLDWYERAFAKRKVLGLHEQKNVASGGVFAKLGFVSMGVRPLRAFGEGVEGCVWVREGMSGESGVYGI